MDKFKLGVTLFGLLFMIFFAAMLLFMDAADGYPAKDTIQQQHDKAKVCTSLRNC